MRFMEEDVLMDGIKRFLNEHKTDSYEDLIKLKDDLFEEIHFYEHSISSYDSAYLISDEKYLFDLSCLSEVCHLLIRTFTQNNIDEQ